jgi:hypothetical protein
MRIMTVLQLFPLILFQVQNSDDQARSIIRQETGDNGPEISLRQNNLIIDLRENQYPGGTLNT